MLGMGRNFQKMVAVPIFSISASREKSEKAGN
jgi:hypothetical protein